MLYRDGKTEAKWDGLCPEPNNFRKRRKEKNTTSTMVNEQRQLRTIEKSNQQSSNLYQCRKLWVVRWRWSHFRAPDPSRDINVETFRSATTETTTYHDKASNWRQKRVDNDRQHRKTTTSNQQSTNLCQYFRSLATRIYKYHCRSCSTRGDILAESLHANRTRLTKWTVLCVFIVDDCCLLDTEKERFRFWCRFCGANDCHIFHWPWRKNGGDRAPAIVTDDHWFQFEASEGGRRGPCPCAMAGKGPPFPDPTDHRLCVRVCVVYCIATAWGGARNGIVKEWFQRKIRLLHGVHSIHNLR